MVWQVAGLQALLTPLGWVLLCSAHAAQLYMAALPLTQRALHKQLNLYVLWIWLLFPLVRVGETLPISAFPASFSPLHHSKP